MSDNAAVTGVLSALLCGVTGFGFYKMAPQEHPYAFTACVIGFCHGFLGLVAVVAGESESANSAKETTTAIMEIVPLPLVNIELFFMSESNNIALGHGLFIVPMAVDLLLSLFKDEGGDENETRETLKNLTILGNITALLYLAINESNWIYGGMAGLAFIAKYGAMFIDSQSEGSGPPITMLAYTGFFYCTAISMGGDA
ncbi:uncharacterized protein LOC115629689 [Scaptodrosophila lebanonensis]|uniref:Uncharacterized protein LOC115629689 n=1 Tax=Drosophila lebanonensis TaxID=7225 RepID=A0A6J2U132_DROLE|nr:uncharacterized protein LOC115629689 [Scaptodrosophila lebanonensis]